jgi:hypothetical protein
MILGFILIVSLVLRGISLFIPTIVWWDAAMYIGMGKLIYSGGTLGLWEPFRPLLWPLILGFFWKLGIDPSVVGKLLGLLSAMGSIYLLYKIGERLLPRAGIFASTLLSFSGVYFFYTIAPLTDIPSTFLALLGVWYALNHRSYLAGVFIGLAFGMRFPQAVFGIVVAISILLEYRSSIKKIAIEWSWLVAGFMTWSLPYFIYTYLRYGHPLYSILTGQEVLNNSAGQSNDLFFYPLNLALQNPFLIISIPVIMYWLYNFRKWYKNPIKVIIISSLVIVGGYFTLLGHKELRYAICFLPYLALASGYGIAWLSRNYSQQIVMIKVVAITVILVAGGYYFSSSFIARFGLPPEIISYYNFFNDKPNAQIISTTPQLVVDSDISIVEIFDTWESASDVLHRQKDKVDYITVNSCELMCMRDDTCTIAEIDAKAQLASLTPVFATTTGSCTLTIYKP